MKSVPAVAVVVGLAGVARGQAAETGAIEGRVTAAGVTVRVADRARGWATTVTTDGDGRFAVPALLPGVYEVTFGVGVDTLAVVHAGRTTRLVADLDAGTAAPTVPADQAVTVFDRRALTDIPRTSQTFDGAMGAAPGAHPDGYGVSFGGASSLENRYYLDGLDTTGLVYGGVGTRIPDELVDQIGVTTAAAGPELDGAEGGFVAVTTRHGTNELHGGVYAAFAPAALTGPANAVTSEQTISVATKPGDTFDLAAELGGPIVRDRAWFYVAVAPELAHTDHVRTISRQTDCHMVQLGAQSPCDPRYADAVPDVDPRTGQPILDQVDSEIRSDTSDAYTLLGRVDVAPAAGQQGSITFLATPRTGTQPGIYGLASSGTRDWQLTSDLAARWTATLAGGALVLDAGLGWHREQYDSASIDPARDATPQQIIEGGSLSTLGNLGGESTATVLGCHDGGTNDPYKYITNCPVLQYALGGPGVEQHDRGERSTAHLGVTARVHAAGLHEVTAGLTGELDAAQQVQVYSGGGLFVNGPGTSAVEDTDVQLAPPASTDPAFDRMCYDTSTVPIRVYRCKQIAAPAGDPASHALVGAAYLRDRWHVAPGLVVDLGARYSAQRLDLAPAVAGTVDPISGKAFPHTLLDLGLVEPRLGVTYDPAGEGRAAVFAHWGRYGETLLDNLVTGYPGFAVYVQDLDLSRCPVDPQLGIPDATTCQGDTVASHFSGGLPPRVAPGLGPGYVDELALGGAVEPVLDLVLGATVVDRRLGRAIEDTQDAAGGHVLVNPGQSPEQGRALDRAERQYDAVELTIARRFARLYVLASYTYSQTQGNFPGDISYANGQVAPHMLSQFDSPQLDANRFGRLPQDRPHLVKLDAAYTQPVGHATALILGGRLRIASGTPVLALGADALYGPDEIYLLPPGALGRTPASEELDAHVAVRHRFARGVMLEAFADVINLFDTQTVDAVDQSYAPTAVLRGFAQASLAISGGSYEDLIWAKARDASGNETSRPLARNTHFGQPAAWSFPIAARFGVRLTF